MAGRRPISMVGLAGRRVLGRARIAPQRVALAVLGVGLAVGLMVAVTGISLGLASQSVVSGDDVDYWVVPEEAGVQSVAVSAGEPRLGDVHAATARLAGDSRIDVATPVLVELLPVRDADTGDRTYVLAVGVVASPEAEVLGLSLAPLEPGDPHYADGTYAGPWTGEVVLNDAAATLTNVSSGAGLELAGPDGDTAAPGTLTVVNVSAGAVGSPVGQTPVAVVHLAELQALTGTTQGDQATQILVSTDDPGVRATLTGLYPETDVVTRSGLSVQRATTSQLPVAVAVAALVAAVVVGVLFVTTLMGLEVNADRRHLGTLAALGFTRRSRSLLVAGETVVVALLGGVVGVVLGGLAVLCMNTVAARALGVASVATFEPVLVGYAVAVSAVIGTVGALYPVVVSRRADPLEVVGR